MKLLFAAAELAPLAQTGGLGDAVAGLASALAARGHEVVCALPGYQDLLAHPTGSALVDAGAVGIDQPEGALHGRWLAGRLASGIELRALDVPALYAMPGLYRASPEDARRFVFFSRASAELAEHLAPDALVAHDWHAALALCWLREHRAAGSVRVATLQVVHNGAHLGRFAAAEMARTGLRPELFGLDGLEFHGDLSLLKGGLFFADRIVAVSPTYAEELCTPEHGGGLDGVYRLRRERLSGIANGIDASRFDPARDDALAKRFSAEAPEGREACRVALLRELALERPAPGRLLGAVGRRATQKGWDVLAEAIDRLVAAGASLALVGDGDPAIAAALERAAARHPGRVAFRRGWHDALARRVYAGSDAVLVPSRFEPCGLVQLLAQRYGALPVAHRVGGLVDTIRDGETGVLFAPLTPGALVAACERAAGLLAGPGGARRAERLLALDVSWSEPARRWEALLEQAVRERHAQWS